MAFLGAISALMLNLDSTEPESSPNSWALRKFACLEMLRKFHPTLIFTQEGSKEQLEYLHCELKAYECFGSKSQDAPGEDYSAIIYNRDQVEVMESGNFWLSETPEVCGSTSWGASTPAVVNWVKFRVKGLQPPGYAFQAYNVRMKTGSSSARAKGALLLWQHISSVPPSIPALMCANFNQNKGSATARFFLGSWKLNGIEGDFKDVLSIARKKINTGHIYSHHRFQGHDMSCLQIVKSAMEICTAESDPGIVDPLHTDWMFRYGRALNPTYCEVVVSSWGGKLPTSHYPLYAEFSLPRSVQAAQ
ncbi:unnamed protein product [Closterium sp. NIES-54]